VTVNLSEIFAFAHRLFRSWESWVRRTVVSSRSSSSSNGSCRKSSPVSSSISLFPDSRRFSADEC